MQHCGLHLALIHSLVPNIRLLIQFVDSFKGKSTISLIIKIIFVILCVIPLLNVIPFLLSAFFAYFYWASLRIHQMNMHKISDPFRRMTFDPEVCFNMGCDYYFFTIELKCIFNLK